MPAKGQKLTPEHNQKLQAAREKAKAAQHENDAAAQVVHEEATAQFQAEIEAAKAESQAAALAEAEEVRARIAAEAAQGVPREPPKPVTPPSYVPTGAGARQSVAEWGPFEEYVLAATPYGTYAVEPGYVMFFEPYEFFDDREKRMRTSHRPIYIWYGTGPGDPDTGAGRDKNFGRNRDQLVRGIPEGMRLAPPTYVESQAAAV